MMRSSRSGLGELSQRELEVLELMARGLSNAQIAETLFLSGAAVAKHVSNIFMKLGLAPGEELQPEIERGKSLVILHQATSEPDAQGMVKVFFELNGQSRLIKVPDRNRAATSAIRRKADNGNAAHLGAPMPGVISTVAVAAGQPVKAGDVLLSIEAMKMETALHAEKDGMISEVLVRAGDQIDAKDLLIVYGA